VNDPIAVLRARIERESDVKSVLEIEPMGHLYRYLIETSYASFPKYVIGITDSNFDDVQPIFKCGLESTARAAWQKATGVVDEDRFRKVLSAA
jgi:hypothetical protein